MRIRRENPEVDGIRDDITLEIRRYSESDLKR